MVSFMMLPQVYRYVEDPVSARGVGDVVSVRCCSGGVTTNTHRLHLAFSVSSVTHI